MFRWILILAAGLGIAAPCAAGRLEFVCEGFEGGAFPPTGWSLISNAPAYAWTQNGARFHEGAWSALVHYSPVGTVQDEWLVTPALDLSGATDVVLTFWESAQYWTSLYGDHHYVMVSTTSPSDPAAFAVALDMTPLDHPIPAGWQQVTVDLGAWAGAPVVYVALRYTDHGGSEDNWWVDDVWIRQPEEHDVKLVSLFPRDVDLLPGSPLVPQAVVQNIGAHTESFAVAATIAASGEPVYEQTVTVADLAPGVKATVTFPAYTVAGGNWFAVAAETRLTGDDDPANDRTEAVVYAYTQPRAPLGLLVTCWDCSGCPQANAALDAYLASGHADDTPLVRVHCWWPGGGDDPMYLANPEQAAALINGTPTGSDYAPHLWLDGWVDAGGDGAAYASFLDQRRERGAPVTVAAVFDPAAQAATVTVGVVEPLVPGHEIRLLAAITEDDVYAAGSNGEVWHHQVFRQLYPGIAGAPLAATPGSQVVALEVPLSPDWVYENLRLVTWVLDATTGRVLNAATVTLPGAGTPVADATPAAARLAAAPNPANPGTTLTFAVPHGGPARLAVYDLRGRQVVELVRGELPAGEHRVTWQGCDAGGRAVASGLYVVRLEAGSYRQTRSLSVVR